jgi:CRP/FNR family cyclic AMP-dependent transcriptional regulator
MPGRPAEVVRLFEYEPDLLSPLPAAEAQTALERTVVECLTLPPGVPASPLLPHADVNLGFLVLEGVLLHRVEFLRRPAVELLGPGDLLRPWRPAVAPASLPLNAGWKVCERTRLAVLDRRFEHDVERWPAIPGRVLDRLELRYTSLALQLALAQLPRLDLRLLCLFWHLADRWGRVERDGVVVHLRVSQATLAALVSARRPSVSHALGALREQGTMVQTAPGHWLLGGRPPTEWPQLSGSVLSGA